GRLGGGRVPDDGGAELERRVEPGGEGARQPQVHRKAEQVGDTSRACHLRRPVGRAVVDDERLDRVEAGDVAREGRERLPEIVLLVEARDLDDELHGCGKRRTRVRGSQSAGGGATSTSNRMVGPAGEMFWIVTAVGVPS